MRRITGSSCQQVEQHVDVREIVRLKAAVPDSISGGRLELGIGMGDAAHEFTGFRQHPRMARSTRSSDPWQTDSST